MDQTHPDPVREAISHGTQRAVQVGSCAMTAAQAYAWHHKAQARVVAERDERARRALQAQIRAEREAARSNWAPALDRQWLRGSGLLDTARAWGAAMPYANRDVPWYEPSAATAMRAAEDRLRDLHPYAMARYQRLLGDGLGPTDAMREAAPLFSRHPHARDAPFTPRAAVEAGTGAAEWVAGGASADAAGEAGKLADAAGLEQRGQRIAAALQERARAEGREPMGQDELRTVLDTVTNLPADVIDRLAAPAASRDADATAASAFAASRSARPWEHHFPTPIREVVAAAAASPARTAASPAAAARLAAAPPAPPGPAMAGEGHSAGAPAGAASLRSGQDWAVWLRQAHSAEAGDAGPRLSTDQMSAALAALTHLARRLGFAVEQGGPAGTASWVTRRIQVPADLAAGQAAAALAHQLGHVLLHEQAARLTPGGVVSCSGLRKVEADSVAWLVAGRLGADTTAITFPYVSSWAGTDPRARPAEAIEATAGRVLAAATTITAHLDSELSPGRQASRAARRAPAPPAASHPRRVRPGSGPPAVPNSDIAEANVAAQAFFRSNLAGSWVPGYLSGRGLGPTIQEAWGAGHAPASWDALTRYLRGLGCPDRLLEAAGLARRSRRGTLIDVFRNRATLPVRSPAGTMIAFIGRAHPRHADGTPKYLNSPQTSLYDKSTTLLGLWEAREALAAGAQPVIVEGPLDAIAVTTAGRGRYAGLAPCGTALTASHAGVLARAADLEAAGVLVAFDADQAGRRAAVRSYHLLSQLTTQTSAAVLPAGQDPAQILGAAGPGTLAAILDAGVRPLADLVTDAQLEPWARWLEHPHGRASALRAAASVVAAMPPVHVARQVARLSALLTLDYATVTDAVTSAVPEVIRRASADAASAIRRPGVAHADDDLGPASPGQPVRPKPDAGRPAPRRGPPGATSGTRRPASQGFPASPAEARRPAAAATPPAGRAPHGPRGSRSPRRTGT